MLKKLIFLFLMILPLITLSAQEVEDEATAILEEERDESSVILQEDGVVTTVPMQEEGEDTTALLQEEAKGPLDRYFAVNGLEQWEYPLDISDLEEGKYNIVIRGEDAAGNIHIADAIDIEIDSASDLPNVSISYPSSDSSVSTRVNILGSADDDDGVDYVEVRLDDGEYTRADGSNYWSYPLQMDAMPDGAYTITARSTDINGLSGEERSVSFVLDRTPPTIDIESNKNGDFVSRKITVEGMLEDSNGIKSLEYSLDKGETFLQAKLGGKKDETRIPFIFEVNTKELSDGALTILLKATDKQNSVGTAALLLYIDNTAPALSIFYPEEAQAVSGSFSILGRVRDDVGVGSLQYTVKGREPVEVLLEPGNPFFSVDIEVEQEKQIILDFLISDIAGNSENITFKKEIDREAGKPVLQLLSPEDGQSGNNPLLSGWIFDNRHAGGITYSLDGSDEINLESSRVFKQSLSDLIPGEHNLTIKAFDTKQNESETQKISFVAAAGEPEIEFTQFRLADKTIEEYSPGKVFTPEEIPGIDGKILFESGSGTALYKLPGGTEEELKLKKTLIQGEYEFQINIPDIEENSSGYYPIEILAQDIYGSSVRKSALIQIGSPLSGDGIFPLGSSTDDSANRYSFEKELKFFMHGSSITDLELLNAADDFSVTEKNGLISIIAASPAVSEEVVLTLKSNGKVWKTAPMTLISDRTAPEITIQQQPDGLYFKDSVHISGSISDNLEIASLEYSLQAGNYSAIEKDTESEDWSFDSTLSLNDLDDGAVNLKIKAEDIAGNITIEDFLFIKDSTSPEVRQVLPESSEAVNGKLSLLLSIADEWTETFTARMQINGETIPLTIDRNEVSIPLDLAPFETIPEDLAIYISDDAGNETVHTPALNFAPATDKPVVQVHVPLPGTLMTQDSIFSGIVLDDDQVAGIEYRVDEGDFIQLPGGNSFEIPVFLSDFTDNGHTLEVRAVDHGGVFSDSVSVDFNVSLNAPLAELISPEISSTNKGIIELTGSSSDENGIESVSLSFDNGNSFHLTEGTEEWKYNLDSSVLIDGNYMVLIRVVDRFGESGLYSDLLTIDNTPPQIDLSSPRDGDVIEKNMFLQLRVTDGLAVRDIRYSITPLGEDQSSSYSGDLNLKEVVLSTLNLSDLPAGRYNLSLFASDETENEAIVSRNIIKQDNNIQTAPEILFPFPGSSEHGFMNIEGKINGQESIKTVTLFLNDTPFDVLEVNSENYFSRQIQPEELSAGTYTLRTEITLENGTVSKSGEREIHYNPLGAWIQIDSHRTGDYVKDRPWISGHLGYNTAPLSEGEEESKQERKQRQVKKLEYSLDNGKQFQTVKAGEEWKFRLETQDLPDGPLAILIRATFNNNQTALTSVFVEVDETAPQMTVLTPANQDAFNDTVNVSGIAFDENGLKSIHVMLRKGGKNKHEIPSFIQGLYLDTHFIGGTTWEFGAGLTFFDDNVRLQAMFGMAPEGRFNGNVFGLKLLANVATLPYGYFFGPDFDFLSSSLAIGSSFQYFSMNKSAIEQDGLILGAMVAQIELLKVELDQLKIFNAYSLYLENQFWFISSDIEGGLVYRMAFGLRVNIF